MGRLGVSATLLASAGAIVGGPSRLRVRLSWVSSELAMAAGDGVRAVRCAQEAIEAAAAASPRHQIKSEVVLAAALCTTGDMVAARAVADAALAATGQWNLVPLQWAIASLLTGVGGQTHSAAQIVGLRDRAAELIAHRGGRFVD